MQKLIEEEAVEEPIRFKLVTAIVLVCFMFIVACVVLVLAVGRVTL
jgi:succinate dehydrogenase hydrophobic anchor subunit